MRAGVGRVPPLPRSVGTVKSPGTIAHPMEIVSYDGVDPDSVTLLNWTCFRWLLTPEVVHLLRTTDRWLPDRFALYAAEDGEALAQVGLTTVDVETVEGTERVGFVWGVCTRPDVARHGLATTLMEETHRLMREEDIQHALLGSRRSHVAHDLYRRLGYVDLVDMAGAVKRGGSPPPDTSGVTFVEGDLAEEQFDIFERATADLLGFVHRQPDVICVRETNFHDGPYRTGLFWREGEPIGYVVWRDIAREVHLLEICCVRTNDIPPCLGALERRCAPSYVTFSWTPRREILDRLAAAGLAPVERTWETVMAIDLAGRESMRAIRRHFGVDDDRFQMGPLDEY